MPYPPSHHPVPVGQTHTYFTQYIKGTITWVMEGGPPLTYAECGKILLAFDVYIDKPEWATYSNHPFRLSISNGSNVKITFDVEKTAHEAFDLPRGPIILHATAYLAQQLRMEDVLNVLHQARSAYEAHVNETVPPTLHDTFRSGDCALTLTKYVPYPIRSFLDLYSILLDLEHHYYSTEQWVGFWSWVAWDDHGMMIEDLYGIWLLHSYQGEYLPVIEHSKGASTPAMVQKLQ